VLASFYFFKRSGYSTVKTAPQKRNYSTVKTVLQLQGYGMPSVVALTNSRANFYGPHLCKISPIFRIKTSKALIFYYAAQLITV